MKLNNLVVLIPTLGLMACQESPSPTAATGIPNTPLVTHETNRSTYSPENSPFRKWSTAQLQKRRRDLYGTVPYRRDRHGVPIYLYEGQPLPQQDEIFAIEAELNRRFQAGDTSAKLDRPIPGTTHI
jgi:hypothetical protein